MLLWAQLCRFHGADLKELCWSWQVPHTTWKKGRKVDAESVYHYIALHMTFIHPGFVHHMIPALGVERGQPVLSKHLLKCLALNVWNWWPLWRVVCAHWASGCTSERCLASASLQTVHQPANMMRLATALPTCCSSIEWRRLYPMLEQTAGMPVVAVDLIGWGFTDVQAWRRRPLMPLGAGLKREHLEAFRQQQLGGRPVVLVGTSLGGTIAADYALAHPQAVRQLVLIDAQGFSDGVKPAPRFLSWLGVAVLRTVWLRQQANQVCAHRDAVNMLLQHMPTVLLQHTT